MNKKQAFSLALASITLGLTACGGTDGVPASTTGSGTTTTAPITPTAVACTAPDLADFNYGSAYVSACVPAASGVTSSRYDAIFFGNSSQARVTKVDFANASCTGTGTYFGDRYATANFASGTTTVASLGADGITPVSGFGRTLTLTMSAGEGSALPSEIPLLTDGAYVLCKSSPPSSTSMRTISSFESGGGNYEFTPTFSLKASSVGTNAINTGFGFDGKFDTSF